MAIKDWSTTPCANNKAPPNGAPRGMGGDDVPGVIRQNMADIKSFFDAGSFKDFGHTAVFIEASGAGNLRVVKFRLLTGDISMMTAGNPVVIRNGSSANLPGIVGQIETVGSYTFVYIGHLSATNLSTTPINIFIGDSQGWQHSSSFREFFAIAMDGTSSVRAPNVGDITAGSWHTFGIGGFVDGVQVSLADFATSGGYLIRQAPKVANGQVRLELSVTTAPNAAGAKLYVRKYGTTPTLVNSEVGSYFVSSTASLQRIKTTFKFHVGIDPDYGFEFRIDLTNATFFDHRMFYNWVST